MLESFPGDRLLAAHRDERHSLAFALLLPLADLMGIATEAFDIGFSVGTFAKTARHGTYDIDIVEA